MPLGIPANTVFNFLVEKQLMAKKDYEFSVI